METKDLGQWAAIDIETTGADRSYDQVIDVGFLRFEGTRLMERYSSLVRFEGELSQFIQKLTGLKSEQLKKAPRQREVELELEGLAGYRLLAHNADFEAGFLNSWFVDAKDRPSFEDSLPWLGLAFPRLSKLNLESFIRGLGLREEEVHRGLEDSLDLVGVMVIAQAHLLRRPEQLTYLRQLVAKHRLSDLWWPSRFFFQEEDDLKQLAEGIELDYEAHLDLAEKLFDPVEQDPLEEEDAPSFAFEFTGDNLKRIWESTETLTEKFPGYRHRTSQVDLSLRVGQAFKNDVHALIQAPTGTGKTLGYLLPASLFALQEGHQVLVATGTKTLQNQAMKKDVPALRRLLGLKSRDFRVRSLVGSSNHLCELLYRQEEGEALELLEQSFEEQWSQAYLDHVFYLNARAQGQSTLTRADLAYVLKMKFPSLAKKERESAVDYRSCTGQLCPFRHDCGYLRGLREAKEANIIVGNHALMFSWTRSFPRPEYIIVDEAHKLEGEVTEACTMRVTSEMLQAMTRQLQNGQGVGSLFYLLAAKEERTGASSPVIQEIRQYSLSVAERLNDHLQGLDDKVESVFKQRPRYTDQFWNEMPMLSAKGRDAQTQALYHHFDSLRFILSDFNQYLLPYRGRYEAKLLDDDNEIMALTRFETFAGQLEDLQVVFDTLLGTPEKPGPREDYACSLKYREGEGFALEAAPIDVGRVLHDSLLNISKACVFTSATLGNAKGDQGVRGIEWATGYSYLEPARRFKQGLYLSQTFDYGGRTQVFLCDDTPRLNDPSFVPVVIERLRPLITELEGRCLLLFSARQRFELARELLLKEFEGKIPVFIQGMGQDVVEEFKAHGQGILLGMESFGEGIDVPGDALQFVFIDKIPDLRMDYVIQKRRDFYEANLGNEFTDYYLSHRTRSLHQKLGRLLRTETDYGAVIVADSRVRSWKGRSMQTLMKLMEPYQLKRVSFDEALAESLRFLRSHQDGPTPSPTDCLST